MPAHFDQGIVEIAVERIDRLEIAYVAGRHHAVHHLAQTAQISRLASFYNPFHGVSFEQTPQAVYFFDIHLGQAANCRAVVGESSRPSLPN